MKDPQAAADVPTAPFRSDSMTSIETYMYGLKKRAHEHHCLVHGTFSVDLTRLTTVRERYSQQVRPVTLVPFWVKATALAVRASPGVNQILFKRFPFGRRIVRFRDVDVNLPVTREVDGELVTFIGTIRGADTLSVGQIQDEIETLQRAAPEDSPSITKYRKLKAAPPFVASIFHWLMTWSPAFYRKNAGSCSLTTLDGMRGDHFFSVGPTTSLFCIGGIGDEVVARDGVPVVRRMMKAALALDNYVVTGLDGLVLARTFQQLLETCSFVDDELSGSSEASAPSAGGGVNVNDGFLEGLRKEIAARARIDVAEVKPDADLVMDLGLSSLDLLSVLAFAEQRLDARFPDEMLGKLTTVAKIEEAMHQFRRSQQAVAPPVVSDKESA